VASARRQRRNPALEQPHLPAQLLVLRRQTIPVRGQVGIILPPVETDLLRLVDGAHDQTDPDREQLDFGERDLDVARHDQALVENSIEYIDEPAGATVRELEVCSHPKGRSSSTLLGGRKYRSFRKPATIREKFFPSAEVLARSALYLPSRRPRRAQGRRREQKTSPNLPVASQTKSAPRRPPRGEAASPTKRHPQVTSCRSSPRRSWAGAPRGTFRCTSPASARWPRGAPRRRSRHPPRPPRGRDRRPSRRRERRRGDARPAPRCCRHRPAGAAPAAAS